MSSNNYDILCCRGFMKLKMAFTALISFMLFFAFQNCSQKHFELNELSSLNPQHIVNEGWSVSNIERNESSLKRSDSNVLYFGFYASAYDQDNIDQVKALSNLVHIDHSSGDVNFIISALRKAKENQLAAIVSVQNIFYDCSGWNCEFRDNIESLKKWKLLRDQIKNHGLISTIFSFYTDEPEMYAKIREAKAAERGISLKIDVIAELQNIASIIKSEIFLM